MENNNIVALHNRMTEAEFAAEWQSLRDTHGDSSVEAGAKRDQAMALLFARSNWTQEDLAEKVGKTRQWVAYRLRFGQFLNFATTVATTEKLPQNLSERRFRGFWEQTNKADNDRNRYLDVIKFIQVPPAGSNTGLSQRIVNEFADGKWHAEKTILNHFNEEDPDALRNSLAALARPSRVVCGTKSEREKRGAHHYIRLFKQEKMISNHEIKEKLAPLIKGLIEEGKKSSVTMSPGTVARLAALLKRHLDEWSE